jgi:hypothetical protein
MVFELPEESFTKIEHLVGDFSHYLVLTTLLLGRTPGRIWVNCLEEPTTALVWDRLNTLFFVMGDSSDNEHNQALNRLIMDTIFPEAVQLQYRKFFLQFTPHQAWEGQAGVILRQAAPDRQYVYSYTLDPNHVAPAPNWELRLPAGYHTARITQEMLSDTDLGNLGRIVEGITACWHSADRYLRNGGIGYCLLEKDVITSWCSTDYVIDNACELYVETFEGHRRQGLATLVASACVQECIAKGLIVHWHCFDHTIASVKIAEKIGLVRTAECPVYIVDLQDQRE